MSNRLSLTNKLLASATIALFVFVTILLFWIRSNIQI